MGSLSIDTSQGIATVTFNRPKTLNAITAEGTIRLPFDGALRLIFCNILLDYDAFGEALRAIDKRKDIVITVLQGMLRRTGRWV